MDEFMATAFTQGDPVMCSLINVLCINSAGAEAASARAVGVIWGGFFRFRIRTLQNKIQLTALLLTQVQYLLLNML